MLLTFENECIVRGDICKSLVFILLVSILSRVLVEKIQPVLGRYFN